MDWIYRYFGNFGVAILLLTISVLSGVMAMGVLKKSQPADPLR